MKRSPCLELSTDKLNEKFLKILNGQSKRRRQNINRSFVSSNKIYLCDLQIFTRKAFLTVCETIFYENN